MSCSLHKDSDLTVIPSEAQVKVPSPQSSASTPPVQKISVPAIKALWSYTEEAPASVLMNFQERNASFENEVPIVLPAVIPPTLTLSVPNSEWSSLQSSAFAVFGSEMRELRTEASALLDEDSATPHSIQVIIQDLNQAIPSGPGTLGRIGIELKNQEAKKSFVFHFRTPPSLPQIQESLVPAPLGVQIVLSPSVTAIPVKRFEMKNNTEHSLVVEMPYQPTGQLLPQRSSTTYTQGNCKVTPTSALESVPVSDRMFLVPEGTSHTQMLGLLSQPKDSVSTEQLPSRGNRAYLLYAIYDTGAADPRMLGRVSTSEARMLSPACAQTQCSLKQAYILVYNWGGRDCRGVEIGIRDGMFCKYPYDAVCDREGNCDLKGKPAHEIQFGLCKQYFIDPTPAVAFYNSIDSVGVGLNMSPSFERALVRYDLIPVLGPDQTTPIQPASTQEVLLGAFNFAIQPK